MRLRWRVTIAIGIGSVLGPQIFRFIVDPISAGGSVYGPTWESWYDQIFVLIPTMIVPVTVYGLLTYSLTPIHIEYHRRKKGLCVKCGYNLKGNVSGVCSECGERI